MHEWVNFDMRYLICILFITLVFSQGGGYALNFDGSNDFITINTPDNIPSGSNAYSIVSWIKANSMHNGSIIGWGYWGSTNRCNALRLHGDPYYIINYWWGNDLHVTPTDLSGTWYHVAATYDGSSRKIYLNGELLGTNSTSGLNAAVVNMRIGSSNNGTLFSGQIDDLSVWSTGLSQADVRSIMHKELAGNESNLVAYWDMSNGTGTSLADNSSNSNTGTLINMDNSDWVTSQAPIGDLGSSYETDVEGIWSVSGTSESDASNGLTMTVSSALSTGNFAVFGNNNTSSISTADLGSVGSTSRTGRLWQFDESGTVAATIKIDISDATGESGHSGTASNYRLLYRSGTTGDFSSVATGSSISGDVVTFNNISIQDGYYAMGAEADASLPVELTSFELLSNRESTITLQWITESEINNLGFILDRRTPNTDWAQIASYITDQELQGQGSVSHQTIYTYADENIQDNQTYDYRLADVDYDGYVEYHTTQLMGLTVSSTIPEEYRLYQNYPNPFNPVTNIRYDIPEDGQVSITIYDIMGNRVKELINRPESAGSKLIQWNAQDEQGREASAGIYFYTITANRYSITKKMLLLK